MKKLLLSALLIGILSGCSSIERVGKDLHSDFSGGLNRTVTVYDQNGKVIKSYKGNIDIEANEQGEKVKFDLNGKRVIIYNATVITEEQ